MQSKWSLTWYDPLGPRMCVLELMNGHVLQTLREQLKVPGSRLEGSELLTSEFLRFRSKLCQSNAKKLTKRFKRTVPNLKMSAQWFLLIPSASKFTTLTQNFFNTSKTIRTKNFSNLPEEIPILTPSL